MFRLKGQGVDLFRYGLNEMFYNEIEQKKVLRKFLKLYETHKKHIQHPINRITHRLFYFNTHATANLQKNAKLNRKFLGLHALAFCVKFFFF